MTRVANTRVLSASRLFLCLTLTVPSPFHLRSPGVAGPRSGGVNGGGMGENDKVKRDETVRHRALSRHSLPHTVPIPFTLAALNLHLTKGIVHEGFNHPW